MSWATRRGPLRSVRGRTGVLAPDAPRPRQRRPNRACAGRRGARSRGQAAAAPSAWAAAARHPRADWRRSHASTGAGAGLQASRRCRPRPRPDRWPAAALVLGQDEEPAVVLVRRGSASSRCRPTAPGRMGQPLPPVDLVHRVQHPDASPGVTKKPDAAAGDGRGVPGRYADRPCRCTPRAASSSEVDAFGAHGHRHPWPASAQA
jgi:hypothetical protein